MDDKAEFIYRQYDLEVLRTYKIKGCVCLDTRQGEYVIRPYSESEKRAGFENCVKTYLVEAGLENVDVIYPNSLGELISQDQYRNPVVIKKLIKGRECSLTDIDELKAAAKALARLHLMLKDFSDTRLKKDADVSIELSLKDIRQSLNKHCLELARVNKYILSGRRTNEFETEFTGSFNIYYRQARRALNMLEGKWYDEYMDEVRERKIIAHQNFDRHSILFPDDGVEEYGIVNFEHCGGASPVTDLYQLLRKALEKNNWDPELGTDIIESYNGIRCISKEEMYMLKAMLLFPEKFWKLADRYINKKKSLITQRSMIKLKALNDQEEKRQIFIKYLEEAC